MVSDDSRDLLAEDVSLQLPEQLAISGKLEGNFLRRLAAPMRRISAACTPLANGRGYRCVGADGRSIAIVAYDATSFLGSDAVLRVADATSIANITAELNAHGGRWLLPKVRKAASLTPEEVADQVQETTASWLDALALREERYEGDDLVQVGFRPPQINAVYATRAHWSVSTKAATLVLPTGTGKTETMLSLLVSERIPRLLVIVPNDQLRSQIAQKFISLGILKTNGLLSQSALHPSVALLRTAPKTPEQLERLFRSAHVVVATMQALAKLEPAMQARLADLVTHLFVDEAHHIGARTWRSFKLQFGTKPVLQFTATPFRNDGARVDGKFIYVYPLRRAQEDRLFKPIRYIPIHGLSEDDTDGQIISRVGEQLAHDLRAGFDHLCMARTRDIARAQTLHGRYAARLPEHAPQLIHSGMSATERHAALTALRTGGSRIIVCVDMLGEGFDLPELKIAALHDKHRSEAITLQFVGRFTRVRRDLGDATVIASVAAGELGDRLRALYAEDADWNHILSVTGQARTERERRREDTFNGFVQTAEEIPLETFEPRLSTVVYRTFCQEWRPENVVHAIANTSTIVEGPIINPETRLVVFVTRDEERLRWTSVKSPRNVEYNMVMAHWDADQELLFINSSRLSDLHHDLAKQVVGEDVDRFSGDVVFNVLHGFRRLLLMNLGLSEAQRKPIRYSMFMGTDIADQLETLPGNRSRTITNLFGQGFTDVEDLDEDGRVIATWPQKATIGCSTKGKIWSYQSTNSFADWIDWCRDLGRRLLNTSITREAILRNVVRPRRLEALPADRIPIAVAWPERFLFESEDRIEIALGGQRIPFFNCEIAIDDFAINGAIRFHVGDEDTAARYELTVTGRTAHYRQVSGPDVIVHRGRGQERRLVDTFAEDPPHIYLADGDLIIGADLLELRREEDLEPFDKRKIVALDWSGVDIRKESQGLERRADSIQRRVIERVLASDTPWDIVFDDDGSGEVADVVAVRREGHLLHVELFHCKYSSAPQKGGRVGDLYEVCGQAQKSIRWAERLDEFLRHLRRREADRRRQGRGTRFERGDLPALVGLLNQWREMRAEFTITVVQPGYSKAAATPAHLELFAATESFLMETWRIPFRVWADS